MSFYKDIYYEPNPYKVAGDTELTYIVYTPDIEFYADTIEDLERGINEWIDENGTPSEYSFKADMRLGMNRLELVG